MKKLYKSNKYKRYNRRSRKPRNKKYNPSRVHFKTDFTKGDNKIKPNNSLSAKRVFAPKNLRFLQNTEGAISFIKRVCDSRNHGRFENYGYVDVSFENVSHIDYSMISILISLFDEFKSKGIYFKIILPKDEKSTNYIKEAGLLNGMYNEEGDFFKISKKSNQLFFEKGSGKLLRADNIIITKSVKSIVKHLTGKDGNCGRLKTILLEICGNAIEWSGEKQQWSLGVKYEKSKAIVTITDLGSGIVSTLNRKFYHIISELGASDEKVLENAFDRKYGSKSQKVNRNKGLPCVKASFLENKIGKLKVVTNNVYLDFSNPNKNRTLKHFSEFSGTLYRWEVDLSNLKEVS